MVKNVPPPNSRPRPKILDTPFLSRVHIGHARLALSVPGSQFDIKAFHWQLIRLGFVPLDLVEDAVDDWILEIRPSYSNACSIVNPYGIISTVLTCLWMTI